MTAEFMLITFILFLAGGIAVLIASRFWLGSVLGYLIAGILISPLLFWAGVDVVTLYHFAEFGVGIAIGMVLALSSTAFVQQNLNEKGLLCADGACIAGSVIDAAYGGRVQCA